jgi:hypothetical protein
MSLEKMTTNEAKEFFGNKINIDGRLFDLNIKKTKGKLEFTYIDDTINNNTKVLLQRKK